MEDRFIRSPTSSESYAGSGHPRSLTQLISTSPTREVGVEITRHSAIPVTSREGPKSGQANGTPHRSVADPDKGAGEHSLRCAICRGAIRITCRIKATFKVARDGLHTPPEYELYLCEVVGEPAGLHDKAI